VLDTRLAANRLREAGKKGVIGFDLTILDALDDRAPI